MTSDTSGLQYVLLGAGFGFNDPLSHELVQERPALLLAPKEQPPGNSQANGLHES
jgi:hypothetical protein